MLKDLFKKIGDIKNQATKVGTEALKTADSVKQSIQTGAQTSKGLLGKITDTWKRLVTKEKMASGIEATSKGAEMLAKGAHLASKGAETVAQTMEKASHEMRKAKDKIKPQP